MARNASRETRADLGAAGTRGMPPTDAVAHWPVSHDNSGRESRSRSLRCPLPTERGAPVATHPPNSFELSEQRAELTRLVRQIQELTRERAELRTRGGEASRRLESTERKLEELRCRLADVARRQATEHLGSAA